jgi:hypothetical protein
MVRRSISVVRERDHGSPLPASGFGVEVYRDSDIDRFLPRPWNEPQEDGGMDVDPIQVAVGILIGMASVIAIFAVALAIHWVSDRRQRLERDEAIEAAQSLVIRQLEEYVRGAKRSSSRPG